MLTWLVLGFFILFILFRGGGENGNQRPVHSVRSGNNLKSRPRRRVTINTSCLPSRTFSLHDLSQKFDLHLVETVGSHDDLWVSSPENENVPVVHVSTRKGLISAIKQIDPHVHVDLNDGALRVAGLTCRVVLVGGDGNNNTGRGDTSTIEHIIALEKHLSE